MRHAMRLGVGGKMPFSFTAACAVSFLFVGCGGDGVRLTDVQGNVQFAGAPLAYGLLEFIPDTSKGHKGPAGNAEVVNGVYSTRNGGKGVIEGPHLVRVTGYSQKPAAGSGDETVVSKAEPPLFLMFTIPIEKVSSTCDLDVPASVKGFGLAPKGSSRRTNDP